jgi:hypothetical protein
MADWSFVGAEKSWKAPALSTTADSLRSTLASLAAVLTSSAVVESAAPFRAHPNGRLLDRATTWG